jgi:hypothetical protein
MFFFNKKKPILKDLIPDNHIDFHSHLLFGIDDGAKNFEETLTLVKAMNGFGITQFTATPHVMNYQSTERGKCIVQATPFRFYHKRCSGIFNGRFICETISE